MILTISIVQYHIFNIYPTYTLSLLEPPPGLVYMYSAERPSAVTKINKTSTETNTNRRAEVPDVQQRFGFLDEEVRDNLY